MSDILQDQFVELFARHQHRIYGYILTILPNRSDAEEVFQQTILILWKKWSDFDNLRSFSSWACGIAHNEVRNFRRKHDRRNCCLSDQVLDEVAETYLVSQDWLDERKLALGKCLDRLQPRHRDLVDRCYLRGMTIRDVAGQLQLKPNALYKSLRRLRRILYQCVERVLSQEGAA